MRPNDFKAFVLLTEAVYLKAFGEQLDRLPHGKAQILSYYIYEHTGRMISYKSLGNYIHAAINKTPHSINPSASTLSILIQYLKAPEEAPDTALPDKTLWYNFRKEKIQIQAL